MRKGCECDCYATTEGVRDLICKHCGHTPTRRSFQVPCANCRVVDRVGLLLGFRSVLLACAAGYAVFALLARSAAEAIA